MDRPDQRANRLLRGACVATWLGVVLVAGCGSGQNLNRYTLEGRVTESLSERNLEGVQLTFTSDTLFTATAQTGGAGRYAMVIESDIQLGQIRAEKTGYFPAETTVYFDSRDRRVDLVLVPIP